MDPLATTPIELSLPGDSRCLHLARLAASAVAASSGLPLNELDDFCVAVDEICVSLIETGEGKPIHLTFTSGNGTLLTHATTRTTSHPHTNDARLALSHQILDALAESHSLSWADDHAQFTVVTRINAAGVG